MVAFFDSNVHIRLLLGTLSLRSALSAVDDRAIRLSPIVSSELLRGTRGRARRSVEHLIRRLIPLEPPSWRRCWLEAGRLLPKIFPDHEEIGISRLQNDCLLALTSRHTGALLLTSDAHFQTIAREIPFRLRMIES